MLKKTFSILIIAVALLLVMTDAGVYSQEEENTSGESEVTEEATEERTTPPDDFFTIYVSATCTYCQQVEEFVENQELEDQVVYREVLGNPEVREELENVQQELGATSVGSVPYMVYEEGGERIGKGGLIDIVDTLAQRNNIQDYDLNADGDRTTDADGDRTTDIDDSSTDTVFLAIGGAVLLFIVGYGIFSSISRQG
jgi:glutaredoxin